MFANMVLTEPYTPEETSCEHHVCKQCRGGVKKLKPTCSWCRDYSKYSENITLKILIESYKKLCKFIKISKMYHQFDKNKEFGLRMKEIIAESEGVLMKPTEVKEEEKDDSQNEEVFESVDEKCDIKSKSESECKEEILEEVVEECEVAPLELDHDNEPMDEIISSPLSKLNQNKTYVPDSTRIIPTFSLNVKVDTLGSTPKTIPLVEHPSTPCPPPVLSPKPVTPLQTPPVTPLQTPPVTPLQTPPVLPLQTTPPKTLPWKPEKKLPSILSTVSPKPNGYRPLGKIKREAFILDPFKTKNDIVGKSWADSVKKSTSIVKSENSCPSASGSSESSPDSRQCSFKQYKIKPFLNKNKIKRKSGCRCGNATQCPGKLTCCGQRCPCYVNSQACLDCKCKGCRNPHRPGGGKVRPHIPQMGNMQVVYPATKPPPSAEIELREQGDTHTLLNGENDAVTIPNILANIPVLNIDTIPNGKSSTWTKSNYKVFSSSMSNLPGSPASSNGSPGGGSLNGLSLSGLPNGSPTMSLSGLPNGSPTMSLSGLSNGSPGST